MRSSSALLLAMLPLMGSVLFAAEPPAPAPAKTENSAKAGQSDKADPAAKQDKDARADKTAKTDPTAPVDKTPADKTKADKTGTDKAATDKADAAASTAAAKQEPATAEKDAETGEKPDAKSAKGPSPQRFIPSEQVRADFDVSFPIDI